MEEKPISVRSENYTIPKYDLTKIQAFKRCRFQYRLYNEGNIPQSHNTFRLWFGEFIHGVMGKSYLFWRDNPDNEFPWSFEKVQEISIKVSRELESKNHKPNSETFCQCCGKDVKENCLDNNRHHKLANEVAFSAVNKWGKYLFPLMSDNEFKFEYNRKIQISDVDRSRYYSIVGIADAIDSIKIQKSNRDNKLIQYLKESPLIESVTKSNPKFNIIIEYKGTSRPKKNDSDNSLWKQNERQVMTYMWLHDQKFKKIGKKAICGIILYLNELYPTYKTIKKLLTTDEDVLRDRFHATESDIKNLNKEKRDLSENYSLSEDFLLRRSMHIVPYDEGAIEESLKDFDDTVRDIETCKHNEKINPENVVSCWGYNNSDKPTCTACDLKGICGAGK